MPPMRVCVSLTDIITQNLNHAAQNCQIAIHANTLGLIAGAFLITLPAQPPAAQ